MQDIRTCVLRRDATYKINLKSIDSSIVVEPRHTERRGRATKKFASGFDGSKCGTLGEKAVAKTSALDERGSHKEEE